MNRLWSVLLTAGAVVGSLCLLVAIAGALFGVKPLVFRSGSMGPEIPAGALALARTVDASDLEVGDVVSVHDAEGVRVTHRVVDLRESDGQTVLTLQGDANTVPDAAPYQVAEADRVFWSMPWLGQAVAFLSSPLGLVLLGGAAMALLIVAFRPTARPARGKRRATRALVAAPVAAAMIVSQGSSGTSAAFTDTSGVTSSTLTAYTVPATALSCGGLGVASVTFSWTAVPGATGYTLHYGANGGLTFNTTNTSRTVTSLISGGTAWVTVHRNFGSVTWSSANSNSRQYTVAVVSLCN